jgi:ribosomal protein S18 acetylase RimI-like enzyme
VSHANIRPATSTDCPLLVELMREFYGESGTPFDAARAAECFTTLVSHPARGAVWLVAAESSPVGYVVLTLGFSLEYGGLDAFVDDLYVQPHARRQGLGRLAMETLFAECRRRGVRALHLEVDPDNEPARDLYAKLGFHDHGRQLLTARLTG